MRSSTSQRKKSRDRSDLGVARSVKSRWRPGVLFLFYLGLGFASGLLWARIANLPELQNTWHGQMISGTAPAPNQYRPLTPWLAEFVRMFMPGGSLIAAYFTLRSVVTGITLFFFDRYLRVWFSPAGASAGALCLAAIISFTYFRVVQESDPINLLAFVLAFWALALGRDVFLIPTVLIGALNRETVAMIPALYLVVRWGREEPLRLAWRTAALGASWALVYAGLLLAYGRRSYYCEVVMLGQNLSSFLPTAFVFLSFGLLWVLGFWAWRKGPEMLGRAIWMAPLFVALHYVVAVAQEVRLYLPLAPILIPLSWWVLLPEARVGGSPDGRTIPGSA